MRVLITGVTGFSGRYMVNFLAGKECQIYGIHSSKKSWLDDSILKEVKLIGCDICDSAGLKRIIKESVPDVVFHFASKTRVDMNDSCGWSAHKINVLGTMTLLDAILGSGLDPKILVPGSSAEFGLVKDDKNPITEDSPFRPLTPYAVSKIAQSMTAAQYYLTHQMKIFRTHTFNYLGPGQSTDFVCSAFARQIADIEMGNKPAVMTVGNLAAYRDFTDIRDVMDAYWKIIAKGTPGEVYNICSGHSFSIRQILELLLSYTDVDIHIELTQPEIASSDVPFQTGSYDKLNRVTGWRPVISEKNSLKDMLDYWRKALKPNISGGNV
ncbi:MAG: NAD-dependent epimerase/dehydratase family protein [Desulfobacteraceae bacterium]|nr:NAD-dependent epimerase/dehydratase family protein [Desulfobacteraceae bacterium]